MQNLTLEEARRFVNQHFSLFIQKQEEAGYHCTILINAEDYDCQGKSIFYLKFCKKDECEKCYKIVC